MPASSSTSVSSSVLRDLPVLLVAVVWGSSFLAVQRVAGPGTVVPMLVLRFGLVLPLLGAAAWPALRRLTRAEWLGGAVLGLVLSGIFLLETYGAVHTSATNAGLIISLAMVLTPLGESALGRTAPPRAFLAAAGLAVLGVALLTGDGGLRPPALGDFLVLGAAVVRSAYVLAMARSRAVRNTAALAVTWVQLATATAVFTVVALSFGPAPWTVAASYGPVQWAWLLHLSVFCTLFAFFVQMWAVRATSPSRVSLLLGTEPLWAAVFGITIAGNRMGPLALLGGALVLVATEWGRRTAPGPRPATGEGGGAHDAVAPSPEPAQA
ncbi:DMT family transporter [Streptomyces sp. SP17BM10]|uniref:DMT family transporter n=1 Tax=Streptomyces sp. SP17BM10 TaxID=3002530 RepID=UPI002E766CBC|nr:DMT family transporter [Streptomyces sp. SP17BM10]MEE1789014.1 DMT family transporter [Streptomyces sp. SP17BM10]